MKASKDPLLDLNYLAVTLEEVLEEYKRLSLSVESDRKKLVDQIIGKVMTFFMMKADKQIA